MRTSRRAWDRAPHRRGASTAGRSPDTGVDLRGFDHDGAQPVQDQSAVYWEDELAVGQQHRSSALVLIARNLHNSYGGLQLLSVYWDDMRGRLAPLMAIMLMSTAWTA